MKVEIPDMRPTIAVFWGVAIAMLVLGVRHLIGGHPPLAPPQLQARAEYEFETFRWPKGTLTATYYFAKDGDTNSSAAARPSDKLDAILEWAGDRAGYDYYGAIGDTVILRRPAVGAAGQRDTTPEHGSHIMVIPDPPQ